jgi:hypothetical protein
MTVGTVKDWGEAFADRDSHQGAGVGVAAWALNDCTPTAGR